METAAENDADAVEKVIEDLEDRDLVPDELPADPAYGGDANVESAEEKGVDLVAPVPGAKKYDGEEIGYEQFKLNEEKEVVACPAGHVVQSTNHNAKRDYTFAQMDAATCRCVRCWSTVGFNEVR